MTIFDALIADHLEAKRALEDLIELTTLDDSGGSREDAPETSAHDSWKTALDRLRELLVAHDRAEETVFYEALRGLGHEAELVEERTEEHHAVETLIDTLRMLGPSSRAWETQLSLLKSQLESHINDEETSIFPLAEQKLGEQECERLAGEFMAMKAPSLKASYRTKSGGMAARPK